MVRFFMRWSWRDLRERWIQVSAIALIIALGTGIYAGLGSSIPWRQHSLDDSYAMLHMYDLRVQFGDGSYVDQAVLMDAVHSIDHAEWITAAEPRLLTPTLVDVSTSDDTIYVPGRLMGMNVADGGPQVNGIDIKKGRGLEASDAGQNNAVLEYQFAGYYDLPASGTLQISGGSTLNYVGQGMTPEYFRVIADQVGFMDEGYFAVVMVPLETAQALTGHPGMANDLVLTLTDDADPAIVETELQQAINTAFGQADINFMKPHDDPAHLQLYGDLEGDDQIFKLIAYLFLAGAAFGTFNLTSRIVEAQRRQIGIGMALGIQPRLLAVRPLLVGIQIAVMGVFFGLGIGVIASNSFGDMIRDVMPMPVFETPFPLDIFARAALLGVGLPMVSTLYPVWRAVRVTPVDAIKTGYMVAKGGGLAPLLARIPVPGKSFVQMPVRNLLRAPRRTILTLLGVAMAITTLTAMFGMLDSFMGLIDAGENEFLQKHSDRMTVALNTFYPVDSDEVRAIQNAELDGTPVVETAEPMLHLGGTLRHGSHDLDISLDLMDMTSALWTPTLVEGRLQSDQPGIVIAEKAAKDLGVDVGDTVTLEHPYRVDDTTFIMRQTEIQVIGIHKNPMRPLAYMDIQQAGMVGMQGLTNMLDVHPADDFSQGDVQRAMFGQPGVASVRSVAAFTKMLKEMMGLLVGFMSIVAGAVMILAFLIAFNSTSINVDERAREIATMFAFGLPIRTVTRMTMQENLITGILGTLLGIGLGYLTTMWMLAGRVENMLPDVMVHARLAPLSLMLAVLVGVIVVALTPLLSIRKMSRMNLPSTLRVME